MTPDAAGLATARLSLRRFAMDDLEWFVRVNADPQVKEKMGGPTPRGASVRMFAERVMDYYGHHPGLGMWVTLERASGERIGFHLLNNIQGEHEIQVGYVLDTPFWGRGYATEMCVALLRYGFAALKLPLIAGITDQANTGSQRVLLKAGLTRRGDRAFSHPAYAAAGPMAYFQREARDWLAEFGEET